MNKDLKIKLSYLYGLPILRKHIKKGITNTTVENIINKYKEIKLDNKKNVNSRKANRRLQGIMDMSYMIIDQNQNSNYLNKNDFIKTMSNPDKVQNLFNQNYNNSESLINKSNLLMNEQDLIKIITPFNSKIASFTNHIYTFTNRPYKKINKNLYNLYIICKSAFISMSSIISQPIVFINPNLIKITLFYY